MGSKICPLAWQNCSIMVALSRAARVTMWYGFFTAVGSFRFFCVWQPDSIESAPTAAYRPSTTTETPSRSVFKPILLGSGLVCGVQGMREARTPTTLEPEPTQIQELAYQLWVERGCPI